MESGVKNATIEDIKHLENNLRQIISNQAVILDELKRINNRLDTINELMDGQDD